jgi:hypothetical protein
MLARGFGFIQANVTSSPVGCFSYLRQNSGHIVNPFKVFTLHELSGASHDFMSDEQHASVYLALE